MYLKSLSVIDYKNIEEAEMEFGQKLNCFLGDNGAGKTNLLDAIYFLSFSKSFFNSVDNQNINHNKDFFLLQGRYFRDEVDEVISAGFKNGNKKQFKRNKRLYKRLSDHIGLFPLVMISPSDSSLIIGSGEERRKFMDGVISQYDNFFLEAFIRYNRALLQRNNLLKQFAEKRTFDADTLSIYDEQLVEHGTYIYQKRKSFLIELKPVFQNFYEFVSGGKEQVVLEYNSMLDNADYRQLLIDAQRKDRSVQHTTVGIHRDDLTLLLGEHPIKRLGSQGQTKTYLIALKFAQFEFLKNLSGMKPILLLDDIFDKLDANRVGKIIELVSDDKFGQIFITDTNREHLDGILKQMNTQYDIFNITEGKVTQQ